MAAVERLMGVGQTAEVAKRVGFFVPAVVSDGLAHTFKGPGNYMLVVSAATSSITLDDSFDIGDIVIVAAHAAVSLYPGTASFIWPTSVGAVHAVSADVCRMFVRTGNTAWQAISSV